MKTQGEFSLSFATAILMIRGCGADNEFFEARKTRAIRRVRGEMSFVGEVVNGTHPIVQALLLANAVNVINPAGVVEILSRVQNAWEHYEGAGRAVGRSPGHIA